MLYWRIQWDDICQIHSLYVLQTTTEHTHLPHTCVYVRAIFFYLSIELSWVEISVFVCLLFLVTTQFQMDKIVRTAFFPVTLFTRQQIGLEHFICCDVKPQFCVVRFRYFPCELNRELFFFKKRIFCTERGFFWRKPIFWRKQFFLKKITSRKKDFPIWNWAQIGSIGNGKSFLQIDIHWWFT